MTPPTPIDRPISKLSFFLRHTSAWTWEVRENAETVKKGRA
ncbi:hypothetical protein [Streptomyces sp. ADI92-24]|nr:hypothetical protein [Streptomyces sp. ADI92-24]